MEAPQAEMSVVGRMLRVFIERSRAYAGVAAITLIFLSIGAFFSTLRPGG